MSEQPEEKQSIFREEALRHRAGEKTDGDVLRMSPKWMSWTYWLLVGVVVVAASYSVIGTVHEYAIGPAVVRVDGRVDVTALAPGTVSAVEMHPGQRVQKDQVLVRFNMAGEQDELDNARREFEAQLVKVLGNPADDAARAGLSSLRARKELAESRVKERFVRAPSTGVVSDVRIRPGQPLGAGDLICTLLGDDSKFSVIAILPGHYRPQLKTGQKLRLELAGYRYKHLELTIESIGDEVVGPAEVQRYLGQSFADALQLSGPVVLVQARLPSSTFLDEGKFFRFYDGMQGTAEAQVRAEPILVTLVPGLRPLFGGSGTGPGAGG